MLPSVRDYHEILVTFQFPCLDEAYGAKADEYIAHLVGHEGPGSLLSALKKRGWVNDLEAGIGETGYDRCSAAYIFDVQMRRSEYQGKTWSYNHRSQSYALTIRRPMARDKP